MDDTIDDLDVSGMLIVLYIRGERKNGLTYLEGPMGFFPKWTKTGFWSKAMNTKKTMITWYHYPFFPKKTPRRNWGLSNKQNGSSFKFKIFKAEGAPGKKGKKYAELISRRYKEKALEFSTRKELVPTSIKCLTY
ncbi:MAG: hypothetical protein CM15mP83_9060 [Flavobacteriaceae bacterium]|nr:MAG: hypothetical protein CM15mP83_9060 [Flavobacteriaceae bacterium]